MYRQTNNLDVIGYSNSDFAGYVDSRKSKSRYIFIMVGGVISWRSVKDFDIIVTICSPSWRLLEFSISIINVD